METFPTGIDYTAAGHEVSSTDASHSAIGGSTAIDYNLGSIHKNAVLIVDETIIIDMSIVDS